MRNVFLAVIIFTFFSLVAAAAPHRYIFRCILDEGIGELYQFTGYKYEKVGAYPIYCGDISGPKREEGDYKTPWGRYEISNTFSYKNLPAVLVKYPNAYDRSVGSTGGRILIHGGRSSVGCVSVQDEAFLREKLPLIARNGEIQIFPSRMTSEKSNLWKELLPNEAELIDQLQSLYASIETCGTGQSLIFSVKIELKKDHEVFGLEKDSYDFTSGSIQEVADSLKKLIAVDSALWSHTGDVENQATRFSGAQIGFKSSWVPFEKIEVSMAGKSIASLVKTKEGFALHANIGAPEGVFLVREISKMKEKKSILGNPVVVYVGTRRYVSQQDDLPFEFNASEKYFQGVIIPDFNTDIKIVTVLGETKVSRASGESGLYVKN